MLGLMAAMILLLPLAASANADRDNVEELLDEWITYAEDEGYTVLDQKVDRVDEETYMIYTIELDPGTYNFLAQGGDNIVDLDMFGYYEDDYDDGDDPFVEDTYGDNYPLLEFTLEDPETIVVEVSAVEFAEDEDRGYFCILFCQENEEDEDGGRDRGNNNDDEGK